MILRNRKAGDRFSPLGRGLTKSLKKLFLEYEIPSEQRQRIAMLECGGRLCWIDGVGVAEFAKVTSETQKILIIREEL